jgi:folate-binding protein YgfZ
MSGRSSRKYARPGDTAHDPEQATIWGEETQAKMSELPYSMIAVRGEDAEIFLQGQLSNDVTQADENATLLAAWCNPKGRVICLIRLVRIDDGYGLILPTELATDIVRRLTIFRFRSKVSFDVESVPANSGFDNTPSALDAWLTKQIHAGQPEIWQAQSEKFTPHMLNLDLLNAIDFDKGCYTGQEIIARTHYRGASKRRCYRFRSSQPVAVGEKVSDGQRDVGEVVNAIGADLLAVVPTDKILDDLTVDDTVLEHVPLAYL